MSPKELRTPPGMRDFAPEEKRQRDWVIERIRAVFERYGYEPIETPSLELFDTLKGKLGEEGEQLLFKILRRGTALDDLRLGRVEAASFHSFDEAVDYALPYDLTVPFARFLAMHPDIPRPFKRYQIQRVWRAEKPQRGRYREFYQCDVDVAGSDSMLADAELVALVVDVLRELGFREFTTRIGHRKILDGIVESAGGAASLRDICIAIDKLDKIGDAGVREELAARKVPRDVAEQVLARLASDQPVEKLLAELQHSLSGTRVGAAGVAEMRELLAALRQMEVPDSFYRFDLHLVRGLDYYTGPVFESVVESPPIGSLTGGGRYDELIGRFTGQPLPATGTSIGLERIIDVMREHGMLPRFEAITEVLVTVFDDESRAESLKLAGELRRAGVRTEVPLGRGRGLRPQIAYASSKGIPLLAIIGPDEIQSGTVVLRAGPKDQLTVPRSQVVGQIRRRLSGASGSLNQ